MSYERGLPAAGAALHVLLLSNAHAYRPRHSAHAAPGDVTEPPASALPTDSQGTEAAAEGG